MTDLKPKPTPCLGYLRTTRIGTTRHERCPHGALVIIRYAKRCKSCAARQRQHEGTNPILLARIKSPNHRRHLEGRRHR